MEIKGYITRVFHDCKSKRYILTVETEARAEEVGELISEKPYRITLKKWSERRSLDSNSYFWVLASKMADVVGTSKEEMYEQLLQRYGLVDEDVVITVKASVDMSKIEGHWHLLKSDGKWSGYIRIKGTSEYTRAEMARFLDMVVDEAKELGVETLPPEELERMVNEIGNPR